MSFWEVFLASMGGSSVLLVAVAFFSKSLVKQLLKKDIEQFKNSLKIAAFERQTIFSRMHDRKIEVIADIYTSLKDVFIKAKDYVNFWDNLSEEKRKSLADSLESFGDKFEKNKIWLDDVLCKKIEDFYTRLITPAKEVVIQSIITKEDRSCIRKKHITWFEACEKYQKDIPEAITALEKEFRQELGVIDCKNL